MSLKSLLINSFLLISFFCSRADEGMWIPLLLKKYNETDLYSKGLKISVDDIYSINRTSLKDAIVLFGRGCTGEIVSDQGLVLTNHHCGFGQIQSHSTIDHDYLTNGFWAKSKQEELPCPGLTVTFLIRMEDVTGEVLREVTPTMSEIERYNAIEKASKRVAAESIKNTRYTAVIKPLYYGNQYFLYVMEVFRDVRLVGAPPSAIGKFGGDTDNWMWPRHTGDFSVFRVYANQQNEPADYSPDNVPYKPKKHFVISLKGVKENDFTMVYGYPFTTQEYLPSSGVKMITQTENPVRIMVRTKKLGIIGEEMNRDAGIRIKYAAKQAGIANGWKKWMGENNGLLRLNAIEVKKEKEKIFMDWVAGSRERIIKYGALLIEFDKYYNRLTPLNRWKTYYQETIWNDDLIGFASRFRLLMNADDNDTTAVNKAVRALKAQNKVFFRDFDAGVEKRLLTAMLDIFYREVETAQIPQILQNANKKYKGDFGKFAAYLFEKSIFTDQERVEKFLDNYKSLSKKKLAEDPVFLLMNEFDRYYNAKYALQILENEIKIDSLKRLYMAGIMEMPQKGTLYPDANATLRLTYGEVSGYWPLDAQKYLYFTTLDGIIEKDNPDIYDYDVPEKLKELYQKKDFGRYGSKGTVPVAFIATNHTTGGNSGSPVLNDKGELIGINFDRDWEGTMSDVMYDPDQCRNISLDIRYCLFIIEKFAGAVNLIEELEIAK